MSSPDDERAELLHHDFRIRHSIANAQVTALASEETGIEVLSDLEQINERLRDADTRLAHVDESVVRADRTLRDMTCHAMYNKIVLMMIAVALLIAVLIVVYYRWVMVLDDQHHDEMHNGTMTK